MKGLVAIYFGWLTLIVGCGGRTLEEEELAVPADEPATENAGVVPVLNPITVRLAPVLAPIPAIVPTVAPPIVAPPIVSPPTEPVPEEPVPEEPAPAPGPVVVKGNASCEKVFGAVATTSFRLEGRLKDGTYALVGRDVTLSFDQISILELSSTADIVGVIVKGTANAYAYTVLSTTATALATPDGSPIGYIEICYAP